MYKVIIGYSYQTFIFVKNRQRSDDTFYSAAQSLRLKIKCNDKNSKR